MLSLLTLGALGTGLAYIWNINVLRAWGPTNASTVTYVTPVVGVLLGVLILGETFGWHEPLGAGLVLLGILLAQQRIAARPTPPRLTGRTSPLPPASVRDRLRLLAERMLAPRSRRASQCRDVIAEYAGAAAMPGAASGWCT